jgi:hypothetical protein
MSGIVVSTTVQRRGFREPILFSRKDPIMKASVWNGSTVFVLPAMAVLAGIGLSQGQDDFETVRKRMEQAKPGIQKNMPTC